MFMSSNAVSFNAAVLHGTSYASALRITLSYDAKDVREQTEVSIWDMDYGDDALSAESKVSIGASTVFCFPSYVLCPLPERSWYKGKGVALGAYLESLINEQHSLRVAPLSAHTSVQPYLGPPGLSSWPLLPTTCTSTVPASPKT